MRYTVDGPLLKLRRMRHLRASLREVDPAASEWFVVSAESLERIESSVGDARRDGVRWRVNFRGVVLYVGDVHVLDVREIQP